MIAVNYALVTGATSGIGFAIAKKLVSEGRFVFVGYAHDEARARAALAELRDISPHCELLRADLSGYGGADELIRRIDERNASLEYVVLNHGLTDRTPFGEVTPQQWEAVMTANVGVPFYLLQSLYSRMEDGGGVVCISSAMAAHPHAVSISYGVSKAALTALCRNLVKVTAARGIRVNAIEPGFIDTPWQREKPPQQRARIEAKIALRRFGSPDEVADLCWSVLQNGYINGAAVALDGGYCVE